MRLRGIHIYISSLSSLVSSQSRNWVWVSTKIPYWHRVLFVKIWQDVLRTFSKTVERNRRFGKDNDCTWDLGLPVRARNRKAKSPVGRFTVLVIKKKSVNVKTNQSKQQSKHREKFWNIYCAASVDEDTFEGTSEFCTTTNPPTDTAVSEKGFSAERERERENVGTIWRRPILWRWVH